MTAWQLKSLTAGQLYSLTAWQLDSLTAWQLDILPPPYLLLFSSHQCSSKNAWNYEKNKYFTFLTFLKIWPVKVLGGRCLSVWGPRLSPYPPITHCMNTCTPIFIHTGKGGRGRRWNSEKIRGALGQIRGRKYQHDWLHLQSINSLKHQKRRHLGFVIFIEIQGFLRTISNVVFY